MQRRDRAGPRQRQSNGVQGSQAAKRRRDLRCVRHLRKPLQGCTPVHVRRLRQLRPSEEGFEPKRRFIRDPDTSQHNYGVGSTNALDGLRSNDQMLGQLRAKLRELDLEASTDLIVVSDHAHSNVARSSTLFPLRAIENGAVGAIDPNGYSVSGMIRLADLMHREGFAVFDGLGCSYLPVSMGVKADGTPVYPVLTDTDGKVYGKPGQKYNSPPYRCRLTCRRRPS